MDKKTVGLSGKFRENTQPKSFTKNPIKGTKYTIAISSAKGGVGKSTFAANFAMALKATGSKVGILEFLHPKSTIMAKLFKFYFNNILPRVASLFSNSKAYRYLPESVENFMTPEELKNLLEEQLK